MAVDAENRWMPPSPHREKIIEELQTGRLTLEEQGHGLPPLVRHEDGGTIELANMRWNGTRWRRAEAPGRMIRETAYSDVCGCSFEMVDILKGGENLTESNVDRLRQLQDDVLFMVARMDRRHAQYAEFAGKLEEIARKMREAAPPDPAGAGEYYEQTRGRLAAGRITSAQLTDLLDLTERARLVAQRQEDTLQVRKELAIQVALLFEGIRGARNWDKAIAELAATNGAGPALSPA